ncbi:MAG: hypothetical protein QOJ86_3245 [Bradyrhizobium sp.]|jgi:hypothetical protein|nr:hypothetical protein [Bradyrhizobium sp.]
MLQKFAPVVKRQVEYWQRQIDQYGPDHPRYRASKVDRYKQLVVVFTDLFQYLNELEGTDLRLEFTRPERLSPDTSRPKRTPPPRPIDPPPPAHNPPPADEFSDLPPELLAELSEGAKVQVDPIIKAINDRGGTATLDQILIDLYRATGQVHKRTLVQNKMFRLSKREMCWPTPGRKGIYTTQKPAEAVAVPMHSEQVTKSESPPAATDGPSRNDVGVAGLPGGPKKTSEVGPTPTASTLLHRNRLMSETAAVSLFSSKNSTGK